MDWFKMFAEWGTDPKIQIMPEAMRCRHAMLLCLRCTTETNKLSDEEIALYFRIDMNELKKTKTLFVTKGFIDGNWNVLNWSRRQLSVSDAALRMRRVRERQRNSSDNGCATVRERVAPIREEERREEKSRADQNHAGAGARDPTPPTNGLRPEFRKAADLAATMTADLSWGDWVHQQGCAGHSAEDIEDSIREAALAGKLTKPYAGKILQRWAKEGKPQSNGRYHSEQAKRNDQFTPEEIEANRARKRALEEHRRIERERETRPKP